MLAPSRFPERDFHVLLFTLAFTPVRAPPPSQCDRIIKCPARSTLCTSSPSCPTLLPRLTVPSASSVTSLWVVVRRGLSSWLTDRPWEPKCVLCCIVNEHQLSLWSRWASLTAPSSSPDSSVPSRLVQLFSSDHRPCDHHALCFPLTYVRGASSYDRRVPVTPCPVSWDPERIPFSCPWGRLCLSVPTCKECSVPLCLYLFSTHWASLRAKPKGGSVWDTG